MVRKMVERQCWIMHIVNRVNKADTYNTVCLFACFFNLRRKAMWESFYHYFLQTLKSTTTRKEKSQTALAAGISNERLDDVRCV